MVQLDRVPTHVALADAAIVAKARNDTFYVLSKCHVVCVVVLGMVLSVKRYSLPLVLSTDFVDLRVNVVLVDLGWGKIVRALVLSCWDAASAQGNQEFFVVKDGPVFAAVRDQER